MRIIRETIQSLNYLAEKYRFICAKRKANRQHYLDGKRYWVIKLSNRYYVFSTVEVKELKRRGIFQKDLDFIRLKEQSAYDTDQINTRR